MEAELKKCFARLRQETELAPIAVYRMQPKLRTQTWILWHSKKQVSVSENAKIASILSAYEEKTGDSVMTIIAEKRGGYLFNYHDKEKIAKVNREGIPAFGAWNLEEMKALPNPIGLIYWYLVEQSSELLRIMMVLLIKMLWGRWKTNLKRKLKP